MNEEFLQESKVICKIDDCIYNTNKNCRRTEITIDWDVTPTCTDYKEL